jgi:hypothetical protein
LLVECSLAQKTQGAQKIQGASAQIPQPEVQKIWRVRQQL